MIYLRHWISLSLLVGAICWWSGCATSVNPESGNESVKVYSGERLPAPQNPADRAYLGLTSDGGTFDLLEVQGELVLVDLFDLYCRSCQTAAKFIHQIHTEIEARGRSQEIKLVGLAVGNTAMEANLFRKKMDLPFPVFPDRKGTWAMALGGIKVPSLVALRRQGGQWAMIHRSTGIPREPIELLDHILNDLVTMKPKDQVDSLHINQVTCEQGKADCLPLQEP